MYPTLVKTELSLCSGRINIAIFRSCFMVPYKYMVPYNYITTCYLLVNNTTIKKRVRQRFHGPAWSPRGRRSSGNEYENNKYGKEIENGCENAHLSRNSSPFRNCFVSGNPACVSLTELGSLTSFRVRATYSSCSLFIEISVSGE